MRGCDSARRCVERTAFDPIGARPPSTIRARLTRPTTLRLAATSSWRRLCNRRRVIGGDITARSAITDDAGLPSVRARRAHCQVRTEVALNIWSSELRATLSCVRPNRDNPQSGRSHKSRQPVETSGLARYGPPLSRCASLHRGGHSRPAEPPPSAPPVTGGHRSTSPSKMISTPNSPAWKSTWGRTVACSRLR